MNESTEKDPFSEAWKNKNPTKSLYCQPAGAARYWFEFRDAEITELREELESVKSLAYHRHPLNGEMKITYKELAESNTAGLDKLKRQLEEILGTPRNGHIFGYAKYLREEVDTLKVQLLQKPSLVDNVGDGFVSVTDVAETLHENAVLRKEVLRARDHLLGLPIDCLGSGCTPEGQQYSRRDEMVHRFTKALGEPV
jgi:hypothetical protein